MTGRAPSSPNESRLDAYERECERCGHVFATVAQRRRHQAKGDSGERVLCPCGDVCSEGADNGD